MSDFSRTLAAQFPSSIQTYKAWAAAIDAVGRRDYAPALNDPSAEQRFEDATNLLAEEANGGTPPSGARVPIVLLAGAIKWWWMATCLDCGHWDDAEIMRRQPCPARPERPSHNLYVWWDSPERRAYFSWREAVRERLIAEGYLTYAPWMAFKGQWDERAQGINDSVISVADAVVVMSPDYAVTEGTDLERRHAKLLDVPIIEAPFPKDTYRDRAPALDALVATLGSLR